MPLFHHSNLHQKITARDANRIRVMRCVQVRVDENLEMRNLGLSEADNRTYQTFQERLILDHKRCPLFSLSLGQTIFAQARYPYAPTS